MGKKSFATTGAKTALLVLALFLITAQAAFASCVISITPTQNSFDADGGTGTIRVSAEGSCKWKVNSDENWIDAPCP